ncbi:hypothetical protein AXE80_08040 [Wenyingzhuangia fucanilytica]|uniref:Sialate O-acetylesterase domain-containing protein n=1 Tax=Wenyingzhuangia fucanilytica TaxID=1790137 RepID=A0A1B1Y644_9FLAO|nr:sialate O-acetylesterase [Wenyingzhuangia fucanilytica]ANW96230.1 hypothetical protein AXE80_08040 [Wenyingzhuangia fucanilytica]
MYKNKIILICSLFCALCFAQKKEVQVVLLAGQSNMQGHGNYEALEVSVQQRIEKIANRVLLSTSNNPNVAARPLSYFVSTNQPEKYKFTKHFGPEIMIGLTLAEKFPNQEFLLIKTAVGGTSLYGAWNPNWSQEKANLAERGAERKAMKLYEAHLTHVQNDLKRLKAEGKPYKILGMVWMQGEGDTNKEITAKSYKENLTALIKGCRTSLEMPQMPFVIGEVNPLSRKYKEGPDLVRKAMEEVANQDKNTGIVKTSRDSSWSDYPKHSDNLHYNTEGQKRLGTAMAKELILLLK